LTLAQKALLAVTSGVGAALYPERADLVGAANETTGFFALRAARDRMRADTNGARILRDRPRITALTLERARACAKGTLGNAWATFMNARAFDPNDRPPVRFVDDEELAYVAARSREAHDMWHVLFECPTTVQGELALKALEFAQSGAPAPALAALVASARLEENERRFFFNRLVPWARRAGARAADLVCLPYEDELESELSELRLRWRIDIAPTPEES
jgi:ubiquinone biosynthesis protein COQ4